MPPWLLSRLPDWAKPATTWLLQPSVLIALGVFSAVVFVASLIGVPMFLARMPAHFFSARERERFSVPPPTRSRWRWRRTARIARNALGTLLLLMGVATLVLPGQGILTILVALCLVDFPGKHRLLRRIVASPRVFAAINSLRQRAGQPPLDRSMLTQDEAGHD